MCTECLKLHHGTVVKFKGSIETPDKIPILWKNAGRCIETNIIIATIKGRFTPATFVEAMAKHNIKLFSVSNTQIRLVLHLNVTKQMVAETINIINNLSYY